MGGAPRKKIGILQPVYLPWLGYFEQMALTDLFVHFDTVQHTRRDWRNRNRIVMGEAQGCRIALAPGNGGGSFIEYARRQWYSRRLSLHGGMVPAKRDFNLPLSR